MDNIEQFTQSSYGYINNYDLQYEIIETVYLYDANYILKSGDKLSSFEFIYSDIRKEFLSMEETLNYIKTLKRKEKIAKILKD